VARTVAIDLTTSVSMVAGLGMGAKETISPFCERFRSLSLSLTYHVICFDPLLYYVTVSLVSHLNLERKISSFSSLCLRKPKPRFRLPSSAPPFLSNVFLRSKVLPHYIIRVSLRTSRLLSSLKSRLKAPQTTFNGSLRSRLISSGLLVFNNTISK